MQELEAHQAVLELEAVPEEALKVFVVPPGEVLRAVTAAAESLVEALREVEARLGGRGEEEAV